MFIFGFYEYFFKFFCWAFFCVRENGFPCCTRDTKRSVITGHTDMTRRDIIPYSTSYWQSILFNGLNILKWNIRIENDVIQGLTRTEKHAEG